MKYLAHLLLLLSLNSFSSEEIEVIPERTDKNGYVEPFKMFDDLYYVGDKWVSSYLVKTSAGLVLIDSLESPYGHWIPESIEKLGLDPKEIKYILITHGHSDHVGSAEYLQSKYNAKVIMSYEDFILARSQSAKSAEESHFLLPSIDSFAKDDDELVVGEKTFKFYLTPGHTRGCLSIEFYV